MNEKAEVDDLGTLGMDEAMRLLRKSVANKGEDYVYDRLQYDDQGRVNTGAGCVYVIDNQPSCIVGHALVDFGIEPSTIVPYNQLGASSLHMREEAVEFEAACVFAIAQAVQDDGGTWGEALAAAERRYAQLGGVE